MCHLHFTSSKAMLESKKESVKQLKMCMTSANSGEGNQARVRPGGLISLALPLLFVCMLSLLLPDYFILLAPLVDPNAVAFFI